jgi:tetratricopeptide (TPR) repeat protein
MAYLRAGNEKWGSYQAMGELRKAEDGYRKAIALSPNEGSYYTALASLLRKEAPSHQTEPVPLLEKALALNPKDDESKLILAACFEKEGKLERSKLRSSKWLQVSHLVKEGNDEHAGESERLSQGGNSTDDGEFSGGWDAGAFAGGGAGRAGASVFGQ